MSESATYRKFYRLSTITVVAVYFLILVGGIVRSTGAGMGCPDWPKCFGSWVPPTDISQLPDNYKEIYSDIRHEKNERFAGYLRVFGMEEKADAILNDESIREEDTFNATKTWIEYLNRLTGVVIGFLIMATFFYSVKLRKKDKGIFILSLASLIAVIFQGWIGSVVVSTKLLPWMISIHMLLALVIVMLLIMIRHRAMSHSIVTQVQKSKVNIFLVAGLVLMVLQVLLGTQVREAIDVVAVALGGAARDTWVSQLGVEFYIHRSFSLLLLIVHVALIASLWQLMNQSKSIKKLAIVIGGILVLEILTGVIMAYFGIPPFIQPVHLLMSTVLVGLLFMLFLHINVNVNNQTKHLQNNL